jgi:hypothetical protein
LRAVLDLVAFLGREVGWAVVVGQELLELVFQVSDRCFQSMSGKTTEEYWASGIATRSSSAVSHNRLSISC